MTSPIATAVAAGLSALDPLGLRESIYWHQRRGVVSDAANGTFTSDTRSVGVSAVLSGYSLRETDGDRVRTGDLKCLMLAADLGQIEPRVGDTVKRQRDSSFWIVVSLKATPGSLTYTAQLRAPGTDPTGGG